MRAILRRHDVHPGRLATVRQFGIAAQLVCRNRARCVARSSGTVVHRYDGFAPAQCRGSAWAVHGQCAKRGVSPIPAIADVGTPAARAPKRIPADAGDGAVPVGTALASFRRACVPVSCPVDEDFPMSIAMSHRVGSDGFALLVRLFAGLKRKGRGGGARGTHAGKPLYRPVALNDCAAARCRRVRGFIPGSSAGADRNRPRMPCMPSAIPRQGCRRSPAPGLSWRRGRSRSCRGYRCSAWCRRRS